MKKLKCPRSRQFEHAEKPTDPWLPVETCNVHPISLRWQWTPNWLVFRKSFNQKRMGQRKNSKPSSRRVELQNWSLWLEVTTIDYCHHRGPRFRTILHSLPANAFGFFFSKRSTWGCPKNLACHSSPWRWPTSIVLGSVVVSKRWNPALDVWILFI